MGTFRLVIIAGVSGMVFGVLLPLAVDFGLQLLDVLDQLSMPQPVIHVTQPR